MTSKRNNADFCNQVGQHLDLIRVLTAVPQEVLDVFIAGGFKNLSSDFVRTGDVEYVTLWTVGSRRFIEADFNVWSDKDDPEVFSSLFAQFFDDSEV